MLKVSQTPAMNLFLGAIAYQQDFNATVLRLSI